MKNLSVSIILSINDFETSKRDLLKILSKLEEIKELSIVNTVFLKLNKELENLCC